VGIGDAVEVSSTGSGETFEMTVVGTAMINDNFEASPGRGAVVTPEFIEDAAAEIVDQGDPVVIGLAPGTDVEAFIDELRSRVDTAVELPVQQAAVRNVGRIRDLPYVMAAVVALLALASMVHALVLAVRRHRRALGVLKGIGFTRPQVRGAVAWQATAYATAALTVALPLGVVVGRWGWRVVAGSLGVPAVPVVPVAPLVLVVIALLALANLAAAYPAWRASRMATAAALRAE
jgi:putative ABC transport system permease protein